MITVRIDGIAQKQSQKRIIEAAASCLGNLWWQCLQHSDVELLDLMGIPYGDILTRCNKVYDMSMVLKAIAANI